LLKISQAFWSNSSPICSSSFEKWSILGIERNHSLAIVTGTALEMNNRVWLLSNGTCTEDSFCLWAEWTSPYSLAADTRSRQISLLLAAEMCVCSRCTTCRNMLISAVRMLPKRKTEMLFWLDTTVTWQRQELYDLHRIHKLQYETMLLMICLLSMYI
jgi:hypothetical protein